MPHITIPQAIEEIKNGGMIILVDDEDRENEGDLIMAAEKVTPEAINFVAKHGRGLVCLAATRERMQQLDLQPMVSKNTAALSTHFTVSVDAAEGTTTGISAADRVPPPGVSAASSTSTFQPARASTTAAISPFGPEPTTITSYSMISRSLIDCPRTFGRKSIL